MTFEEDQAGSPISEAMCTGCYYKDHLPLFQPALIPRSPIPEKNVDDGDIHLQPIGIENMPTLYGVSASRRARSISLEQRQAHVKNVRSCFSLSAGDRIIIALPGLSGTNRADVSCSRGWYFAPFSGPAAEWNNNPGRLV